MVLTREVVFGVMEGFGVMGKNDDVTPLFSLLEHENAKPYPVLLKTLFKAREDDEWHQESRQDRPDQIMHQQVDAIRGTREKVRKRHCKSGTKSNAIFALPGHGSTSSVGRKSNAIFALPGHGSTSSVGRKSNAIFALPGHGSTSSVSRKSNAIFALPGHGSTSSVGLYYTGSAFIIINPSHHALVRNEREWYLDNVSVTPTIENIFFLRGLYRLATGNQALAEDSSTPIPSEFFEDQRCPHFSSCSDSTTKDQDPKETLSVQLGSLVGNAKLNAKLNDVDLL
ncbi:hypothetical protein Tco_0641450 [Tanacetum coccineum]